MHSALSQNYQHHAFSACRNSYSMKVREISMKWIQLSSFRNKITFLSILLFFSAWTYYSDFYAHTASIVLAFLIMLEVVGMFLIGYSVLSKQLKFPRVRFWLFVLGFTVFRFLIVYFVLQHGLPEWTVFHYPERSIFFLFFTSAAFIFFGYSYAIYEWGLAARREYTQKLNATPASIAHPIIIRCEGKEIQLLPQEIIALQANGEYINYLTSHGNYMCFQRMKVAAKELLGYGFVRVHRSFIVNPHHIKAKSQTEIEMKNGMKLPISKTYRESIAP